MVKKAEALLFAIAILLCGVACSVAVSRDNSPIYVEASTKRVVKDTPVDEFIAENVDEKIDEKVNINTASKVKLQSLYGIGEARANKIIEYRKLHRFSSTEEIMNVSGIGEKTFQKIKFLITVD